MDNPNAEPKSEFIVNVIMPGCFPSAALEERLGKLAIFVSESAHRDRLVQFGYYTVEQANEVKVIAETWLRQQMTGYHAIICQMAA